MDFVRFEELLAHNAEERGRWLKFFRENPGCLELSVDIAQAKNVRELVLHILAVELRYSERLLEERVTEYAEISAVPIDSLFATGGKAEEKYRRFLCGACEKDWTQKLTFPTRSAGTRSATKRKIFIHSMLHSQRHWAQIATHLRQHGYATWPHDFLFSETME